MTKNHWKLPLVEKGPKHDILKESSLNTSSSTSIRCQTDEVNLIDNAIQCNVSYNSRDTQTDKISKGFKKLQTQQPIGLQLTESVLLIPLLKQIH